MSGLLRICRCSFAALLLLALSGSALAAQHGQSGSVLVLRVDDAIGPAIADYVHRGIETAVRRHDELVVLQLDTPGGLDTSMRKIIRDMLASPVPIAVYVFPSGARAASAGTYIMYAAQVAAMAPGTNVGAATPIQLGGLPGITPSGSPPSEQPHSGNTGKGQGAQPKTAKSTEKESSGQEEPAGGTEQRKMVNDAMAYIRSLAQLRGRNSAWAQQAVLHASSLSAQEALQKNVIDVIANGVPELLKKIDGRTVQVNGQPYVLKTGGLHIVTLEPNWRNKLLAVITNPNVAYMLMLLGIYGLFFELANPGHMVPGVIGAVSLLLALYAMQVLPVNYAGLALILTGIGFMIAELFVPSFGALGIGGVIAFIIGSVILFNRESGGLAISLPLIIAVALVTAGFFLIVVRAVLAAHRRPVVSGSEQLVGASGEVLDDFEGSGFIHIHGENWQARSTVPLKRGSRVRVTSLDGLILNVEPEQKEEKS